jgi:hypothetical protein
MAILWVGALVSPASRNRRFLAFLLLGSFIVVGAARSDGTIGRIVEVGVSLLALVAFVAPRRFGLGSLDAIDDAADATLRQLAIALDGAAPDVQAPTFLTALHAPPFTTPGNPWRTVGRCYRVILNRLGDPDAGMSQDRTPLGVFRRAGRHYWKLALDRRVIGRPHQPSAWDEDVLLRCFLDEFDRLLPPGSSLAPFVGHDGWDLEAGQRIDEVEDLRLQHSMAMANRRLLVDVMGARLAVALGDLSDAAVDRMRSATVAKHLSWQPPEENVI